MINKSDLNRIEPHHQYGASDKQVAILGGGPAGLATAWALEHRGVNYRVWEADFTHGGNARTIRVGDFLYDTGPHRFHDREPMATKRVAELLGPDLLEVSAPSRICLDGQFVDFPLRPLQALTSGGASYAMRAISGLLAARMRNRGKEAAKDFAYYANSGFGQTIAQTFLIPFSEKLWGMPATELSPDISGRRLPGFNLKGILKDSLLHVKRAQHLEGRFLYPRLGYGQIADKIVDRLSPGRICYGSRVSSIETKGNKVVAVGTQAEGDYEWIFPSSVVNTLPITTVVRMMNPQPPSEVLDAAAQLCFRDVILVTLLLDQSSVSNAAVTYFPDPNLEFTRIHEPRNRSRAMSPAGKTSLVAEFPCFRDEEIWQRDEQDLVKYLIEHLVRLGIISSSCVIKSDVKKLLNAYPVYSKDYKAVSGVILSYLKQFQNLWTIGRGGSFFYGHVHDFISDGFATADCVDAYLADLVPANS